MYPNYQVVQTGLNAYCNHSAYCNIQVPFIADFTYQILCNDDGTFQVHADDNTYQPYGGGPRSFCDARSAY